LAFDLPIQLVMVAPAAGFLLELELELELELVVVLALATGLPPLISSGPMPEAFLAADLAAVMLVPALKACQSGAPNLKRDVMSRGHGGAAHLQQKPWRGRAGG
jgi:hypothetical protein